MGKLECNELTKVYQDHRKALDNVSFSVETNGIFGLIGRNGAGKTTLIRILATELEPTAGTAIINDLTFLRQAEPVKGENRDCSPGSQSNKVDDAQTNRFVISSLARIRLQGCKKTRS